MAKRYEATGDCYEAAVKLMMKLHLVDRAEPGRYILAHAEVVGQGPLAGVQFGHGFVIDTVEGIVIDQSNGRDIRLPIAVYYAAGGIDKVGNEFRYTYKEMAKKLVAYGHYGPWDLQTTSGL